ncbi:phosphatase PAP2 family protein [Methylobacterium gossipiicola]|uniref:PAP2 superfamily protein n=1 Tax=Methylobacterium gossipiicola TaxID=582675 RepID=A0A1I2XAF3_9HYPH|nr:phosphatase PAP2 family protein [Methylobacterium gossipiicola]SFH10510.1 PAP2 superfamily protein [Methylobacterium gossipiicola]
MLAPSPNPNLIAESGHLPGEAADIALGIGLARHKDTPAVRVVGALSEVGAWEMLVAASAATLAVGAVRRDARTIALGRHMLGAGLLASLIKTTVKRFVHRSRPNVVMETGRYERGWFGPNDGPRQSFPSGHAAVSVAVARAVGRACPDYKVAAGVGAGLIVAAQVLRGAHYPSDVVAGTVIGLAAEAAVNRLSGPEGHRHETTP